MRFGVLGTGHWAADTQAAALAAHDRAELVGIWGRSADKAQAAADRHGVRAFTDLPALLAEVDAVALVLPPDVQAELAVQAADAGRHLLLEKPLALTVEAADRVVDAVEANDVASVVFFTNRFIPSIETFLRAGVSTGGWYAAHGTMYSSIFQPGSPWAGSVWRKREGGLWDLGPHALSVVLPLLGPVVEVSAADGPHDTVHLLLRHEGGAASTLSLTLDAAPDATADTFAYFGEHGAITLPPRDTTPVEAFGAATTALIDAAGGGPRHPCDAQFGRTVVRILATADQARHESRILPV